MTLIPDNILSRKSVIEELNINKIDKMTPVWTKRQLILTGDPDSLSDEDLRNHHYENNTKKVLKYFSVLGLPLIYYFFRREVKYAVVISILGYYMSKIYINSYNMTKCDYSMNFAINSCANSNFDNFRFNGKAQTAPMVFWGVNNRTSLPKVENYSDGPKLKRNMEQL